MLQFFYTLDYQDGPKMPEGSTHNLAIHASVYRIAEKYEIMPLKDLAKQKFEKMIKGHWKDPSLPTAIQVIHNTTPSSDRGLRDILTRSIKGHVKELLVKPDFAGIIKSYGDFAIDLINAAFNAEGNKTQEYKLTRLVDHGYTCDNCGRECLVQCTHCARIWTDTEGLGTTMRDQRIYHRRKRGESMARNVMACCRACRHDDFLRCIQCGTMLTLL